MLAQNGKEVACWAFWAVGVEGTICFPDLVSTSPLAHRNEILASTLEKEVPKNEFQGAQNWTHKFNTNEFRVLGKFVNLMSCACGPEAPIWCQRELQNLGLRLVGRGAQK